MPMPKKATKTRKIQSKGPLFRSFLLDRSAVNEEERTVEFTFSSETDQVERWYGIEILDHGPKSVRLERMRAAGPLLFLHNMRDHLGVVEDIRIESRKGKVVCRFGRSALAEEKFQDVKDGVLVNVSVGYRVFKMVLEETGTDGKPNVYRCTDWEPYEVSLLPVAADISVGVGRAAGEEFEIEIEERAMDEDEVITAAPETNTRGTQQTTPPAPARPDVTAVENQARERLLANIREMQAMGNRYRAYGGVELAAQYIAEGKSPADLQRAILDKLPEQDTAGSGEQRADTRLDLSQRDLRNYSLLRAINAVMAARTGDMSGMRAAAFEMECSKELGERLGKEARGFYVPLDVLTRTMNATSNADLVPVQHMGSMFIDVLRPRSVVMGLGATVMDGLDGNLDIPRALSSPSFSWIGDDDDAALSDIGTGSLKLEPKTLAGGVPMSRRLLKQSSPSVEQVVHNALLKGAALGIDLGILAGTGSNNQPRGLFNLTGVNTQTVATPGAPTWPELVGFETKVAQDNALEGSLAYVTTSSVVGNLKTTKKDAGSGLFLMEGETANGRKVAVSNQLGTNQIAFGNWADTYIGFWGVIDVNPDMATKAASGGLVLRVFQDADVGFGHPESFCINA